MKRNNRQGKKESDEAQASAQFDIARNGTRFQVRRVGTLSMSTSVNNNSSNNEQERLSRNTIIDDDFTGGDGGDADDEREDVSAIPLLDERMTLRSAAPVKVIVSEMNEDTAAFIPAALEFPKALKKCVAFVDDEKQLSDYECDVPVDSVDIPPYIVPDWFERPGLDDNKDLAEFKTMCESAKVNDFAGDGKSLVNPDFPGGGSKTLFATNISQIQAANMISDKAMVEILAEISRVVPTLNNVIREVVSSNRVFSSKVFKLELHRYVARHKRRYLINVCEVGCAAYFRGDERMYCHTCSRPRFTKCCSNGCTNEDCNPFTGGHSINARTPVRNMYLRPIIPLLQELVEWSMDSEDNHIYEYATRYVNEKYGDTNKIPPTVMEDLLDGQHARTHLAEMNARFVTMQKELKKPNMVQKTFILSVAYDGGNIFNRHNTGSVWPVVVSILNCNPSDRITQG